MNVYVNAPLWCIYVHMACHGRFWRSGVAYIAVHCHDAAVTTMRHDTEEKILIFDAASPTLFG